MLKENVEHILTLILVGLWLGLWISRRTLTYKSPKKQNMIKYDDIFHQMEILYERKLYNIQWIFNLLFALSTLLKILQIARIVFRVIITSRKPKWALSIRGEQNGRIRVDHARIFYDKNLSQYYLGLFITQSFRKFYFGNAYNCAHGKNCKRPSMILRELAHLTLFVSSFLFIEVWTSRITLSWLRGLSSLCHK